MLEQGLERCELDWAVAAGGFKVAYQLVWPETSQVVNQVNGDMTPSLLSVTGEANGIATTAKPHTFSKAHLHESRPTHVACKVLTSVRFGRLLACLYPNPTDRDTARRVWQVLALDQSCLMAA